MARMIPRFGPSDFVKGNHEDDIYFALSKLPDDYTVVHSFRLLDKGDYGQLEQREADFVIFNAKLGILCIEAKAGKIKCVDGEWEYQNGISMRHGGPYRQAESFLWKMNDRFNDLGFEDLKQRCKIAYAVWFPSLLAHELGEIEYSPEASREITLCKTDLKDPLSQIIRIMNISQGSVRTNLHMNEAEEILHKVLLPEFEIVPTGKVDYNYNEFVFSRLLDSQARVLNFLQDQKTAAINGAAGTGKTLIAIEQARRAAQSGKVLFLCFNRLLKDDIELRCKDDSDIDVFTIAGFACELCDSALADYHDLSEHLMDFTERPEEFPYTHVVIDEGQDFGLSEIEGALILEILQDIIERKQGTMFLFYDIRQFVQGSSMPAFIEGSDCKLTLYVNCRNTQSIAYSSLSAVGGDSNVKLVTEIGAPPILFLSADRIEQKSFVGEQIKLLKEERLDDIVVLTCKTIQKSGLRDAFRETDEGVFWGKTKVPVFTCRTFKGLEADGVILIDVDESLWAEPEKDYEPEKGTVFYTGASRAKHELRIVGDMDEDGVIRLLENMDTNPTRRPEKKLASELGATLAQ